MTNSGVAVVAPLVGRGEREGEDKRGIDSFRQQAGLAFSGKANLIFLKLSGVSARVLVLPVRFPGQLPRGGGVQRSHGGGRGTGAVAPWATADPPGCNYGVIFFFTNRASWKTYGGQRGPGRPAHALWVGVGGSGHLPPGGASGGWRMRSGARRGAAGRACAEGRGRASPSGVPGARAAAVPRCGPRGAVGAMVSVPLSFPAAGGPAGEGGPAVRGGRVPIRRPGG